MVRTEILGITACCLGWRWRIRLEVGAVFLLCTCIGSWALGRRFGWCSGMLPDAALPLHAASCLVPLAFTWLVCVAVMCDVVAFHAAFTFPCDGFYKWVLADAWLSVVFEARHGITAETARTLAPCFMFEFMAALFAVLVCGYVVRFTFAAFCGWCRICRVCAGVCGRYWVHWMWILALG